MADKAAWICLIRAGPDLKTFLARVVVSGNSREFQEAQKAAGTKGSATGVQAFLRA
jgi:hypothetical protein